MKPAITPCLTTVLTLAAAVFAQAPIHIWSPPNAKTNPGGSNNNAPFYAISSTYQQVHDAYNMGSAKILKGMAFRNAGARAIAGRSWDMRLTLSHTTVTPQTVTSTFASNLGKLNTTIVFGSATGWKTFTFKGFTSTGTVNPPAFTIPFSSPYVHISALGNLCWEWRHKNGTSTSLMPMDATPGRSHLGTPASTGKGCVATGRSAPATAAVTTPSLATGYHYRLDLTNAAASAKVIVAIGLTKSSQNFGWCTNLEVTPTVLLVGQSSAQGTWGFQFPLSAVAGIPATNVHAQCGFGDTGLPGGLGLSNLASYKTPAVPGSHGMSRVYVRSQAGNGDELKTIGTGPCLALAAPSPRRKSWCRCGTASSCTP
ncbi:MAG: hypothetical protein ACYTGO_12445 [Planctomycetota bacterium]|jgi:hypothetical protein